MDRKAKFTPEDVTMGGKSNRKFVPENLEQLQFVGEKAVFVRNKNMVSFDFLSKKEKIICTLDNINKALRTLGIKPLKKFPSFHFHSKQKDTIVFYLPRLIVFYDKKKKIISNKIIWRKLQQNCDYCVSNGYFAFTEKNNLFVISEREKRRINPHTEKDIIYGQAAFRNEFGTTKGTFWSPEGNYLAFYCTDESEVSDYTLIDNSKKPPRKTIIKYPSAGEQSQKVSIGIYSIKTKKTVYWQPAISADSYLTNITFSPDEKEIYAVELNRAQNQFWVKAFDLDKQTVRVLFTETSDTYIEPENPPFFINNNQFIWQSKRTGHNHLYLYDKQGKLTDTLTEGRFEILGIIGFNAKTKDLFFYSNENSPLEKTVFSINIHTKEKKQISVESGQHQACLSAKGNFLIDHFSSISIPRKINLIDVNNGKSVNLLTAKNPYNNYQLPKIRYDSLVAADGKTRLYYRLTLPVEFDISKKYPVVITVYGGPHVQMVQNTWLGGGRGWELYWAQQGFVCFTLDGRGSANRGHDFESALYKNIGKAPLDDQLCGVQFLHSLPFVDNARMGVYGWSFGGFMATQLMLKAPTVFKAGVAGGSVIDLRLYEVMYGERYMQTPEQNPQGYTENDLTQVTENLQGDFLMIHCELDPVVRIINTERFIEAAKKAGKSIEFIHIRKHGHNVTGEERVSLFGQITDFFEKKLK